MKEQIEKVEKKEENFVSKKNDPGRLERKLN